MAKEETLICKGKIVEALPNAIFKVELEDNNMIILGHLAGKMRLHKISIIPGDRVDVEIGTYDVSKGRIIFRYKS